MDSCDTGSEWGSLSERLVRGMQRVCRRPEFPFAGDEAFARIMESIPTEGFYSKQGRSGGRMTLGSNGSGRTVYLKRYHSHAWWRCVLATLAPRCGYFPGVGEWQHLRWAADHDIPVPTALAAGERIGPWFARQSFVAVEELAGMVPLHSALPEAQRRKTGPSFRRWKRDLVRAVAGIARTLHASRHYHKDFYLSHFFVSSSALDGERIPAGSVHLIDWHRLARHAWTGPRWRVKDLAQLLFSSDVPGITEHDRMSFFRCYLGRSRLTLADRVVRAVVRVKAWRYRSYNASSRA